mmetsp:Transcript_20292/g.42452  ORF Transcript_20292/g.42452 Transcript_20292/m.42452 type:complete len:106 (-) Transcript_20292:446-763(-)
MILKFVAGTPNLTPEKMYDGLYNMGYITLMPNNWKSSPNAVGYLTGPFPPRRPAHMLLNNASGRDTTITPPHVSIPAGCVSRSSSRNWVIRHTSKLNAPSPNLGS